MNSAQPSPGQPSTGQAPAGIHNFRTVGGFATTDGRWVEPGLLWRSSALLRPHAQAGAELARAGIEVVIDLRDSAERRAAPTTEPAHLEWHHLPIFGNELAKLRWSDLNELYAHMIDAHGVALAEAVDLVAHSLPRPTLVHCTAGKDRTGLVCALILDLIGVPRDTIQRDFVRSGELLGSDYLADLARLAGLDALPGVRAHHAVATPASLIEHGFEQVDRRGGSLDYLRQHGLSAQAVPLLRQHLTHTAESGA